MMRRLSFTAFLILVSLESTASDVDSNLDGAALFNEKCAMCHREMGMGTWQLQRRYDGDQAYLERRSDLTPEFVSYVVRNGLGIMFSISRAEVSDPQLAAISDYLSREKKNLPE